MVSASSLGNVPRHDTLTGLENRSEFEHHLQQLLNQGLHQLKPCTLLYIDLDQFKLANETCCHAAGDEILSTVSRMLRHNVRESDILARLGGGEFGVLLVNCQPPSAQAIAEKLCLAAQALQVQWGDKVLRTSFSIGMVHITREARSAADLLRMADVTCHKAKERGRNRIYAYSQEDHAYSRHVSEMEWVTRIHEALEEDRFCLYAQSIAPLQKGHEAGMHFEVLLRLRDGHGRSSGRAPSSLRPKATASCPSWTAGSSPRPSRPLRSARPARAQWTPAPSICPAPASTTRNCRNSCRPRCVYTA